MGIFRNPQHSPGSSTRGGGIYKQAAALRCLCRPSLISSMILALKASRSPGLRDVMTPLVDDALALGISITCCVVEGYGPFDFLQNLRGTNQIRITIAFMSRDQMSLTLNANALVENFLVAAAVSDMSFGHVPARRKKQSTP
jgi:hypothetical protein